MKLSGLSKTKHRRFWLLLLMFGLIAIAAAVFLLVGLQATQVVKDELPKLQPSPSPTAPPGTFSFTRLVGQTLDPATAEPYVQNIPGVHGLGLFDNTLYVSSWKDRAVYKVDLATGQRKRLADELDGAHDMALDDDGKLVTPLYGEDRVVKIDPKTGRVSELAREALSGPNGIAKARGGGFYVTNAKSGTVVKISSDGQQVDTIATGLKEPAGIISDPDNILYVAQYADPVNSVIQVFDNGQIRPLITGLTNAETLLRDEERNLIVGHVVDGHAALSLFKRGGTTTQLLLQTDYPGPMVGPVTDEQYLYFESAGQSTVYRIALPQVQ